MQPRIAAVHALEDEYRRQRASLVCPEEKERLRAELVAAEMQEAEAERDHLLCVKTRPEVEIKTLFELEWAIVGQSLYFDVSDMEARVKGKKKDVYLACPFCGGDLESFSDEEVICNGSCKRIISRSSLSLMCCHCQERSRHFVVVRCQPVAGDSLTADGKGNRCFFSFCDKCLESFRQNGSAFILPTEATIEEHCPIPKSVTRIGMN